MRLTMVCGSLDPGRDGVGDYSRSLAGGLRALGHQVSLIALRDRGVSAPVEDDDELRLPEATPPKERARRAARFVALQDPDLMSLQFVPFAFHPRGLAAGLPGLLTRVGDGRPWHVMCHELWVPHDSPPRQALLGRVQRPMIGRLLGRLAPEVVHTSIDRYVSMLGALGRSASKLPLFGSIPFERHGPTGRDPSKLLLAYFGSAPTAEFQDHLVEQVQAAIPTMGRRVTLQVAGGDDRARAAFVGRLSSGGDDRFTACDLGWLSATEVDELLVRADVGVSRLPRTIMGKSSVTVAMLERGLPVWAPLAGRGVPDIPFRSDLVSSSLARAAAAVRLSTSPLLPAVAQAMAADVTGTERGEVAWPVSHERPGE